MSFNKLNYDTCSYKQVLTESIGPGEYQLGKPQSSCEPCFNKDPRMRVQRDGLGLGTRLKNIDIDSELLNITRDASNCSQKKFNPEFTNKGYVKNNGTLLPMVECKNMVTEDTKLSNPPCTLRGTGWNRWEWLPEDPQERVLMPFDYVIPTRNVVRDNHRPLIPEPLDQTSVFPNPNNDPINNVYERVDSVPTHPPSVQWRSAEEIRKY
jgi:hypothetical protein